MLTRWQEQTIWQNENIFKINILVRTTMYTHDCAWTSTGRTLLSLTSILVVREQTLFVYIDEFVWKYRRKIAESQIKSKGQKIASGCHQFTSDWDSHHYCWSYRDKKKGDDVCVTSKEADCYICLQFSWEQRKKLKAKKAYQLKKAKDISKDSVDSFLGFDDPPSSTSASSATNTPSTEKSVQ